MKKQIFPVIAAVLLTAISFYLYLDQNELDTAPEISLNTIDGRKIELHTLQGKPLFVTFWATSCAICVKEIPHLAKLYNELNKDKFEIIAIAMPYDPPNRVIALSKQKNIPYTVALDIDGSVARAFGGIRVTPTHFLIDSNGKVVQKKSGKININELGIKVKALLNTSTTVS